MRKAREDVTQVYFTHMKSKTQTLSDLTRIWDFVEIRLGEADGKSG
jgi:hypothetical protein